MEQVLSRLPPLRQELNLTVGDMSDEGAPTWVLQDPVNNRFFQLTWPAFEILSRWTLEEPQAIVDDVNRSTTLQIGVGDVIDIYTFLTQQHLLRALTPQDTERLAHYAKATQTTGAKWLLKNYLFFRLPLVRPQALLDRLAPAFEYVFKPQFWWAIAALLAVGVFLVSRQWDSFTHTFNTYTNWDGILGIGIALSFAKILHELGHALTANRYGCRVPTMGVAFLVMFPVLYTDTTDAWKLGNRRARLHIGAAGMLAELTLAVIATLLWSFLPDGPVRAGVFLLATSTWVITLAINASPFMRFDGYFLLADWLNLPNLHDRAFALGKWWLRERLFGLGDPVPEHFPPQRHRFLIAFAFATAIYRAVLFLSIALLVYHYFFKVLGLVLMLVELIWFLAYPVQREMRVWWQRRADIHWRFETARSTAVLLLLAALIFVPWQTHLRAPAVVGAEQTQGLYATFAAQVNSPSAALGQTVKAGELLVQLESPDLQYRLQLAQNKEQLLRWQLDQQTLNPQLQSAGAALRKRWEGAQEAVNGLQERIKQLRVVAPFDGIIVDRNPALTQGTWVTAGEKLFHIIDPSNVKAEAYLTEKDVLRLIDRTEPTAGAHIITGHNQLSTWDCTLGDIDKVNLSVIDQPYVTTQYGGSIPVQQNKDGQLIPLQARFRVRFTHCTHQQAVPFLQQELAGIANVQGQQRSLVHQAVDTVLALGRSEAGF